MSIIVIVALAVFSPALDFGFVSWDDDFHVYDNPFLNPATLENTLHFWTESYKRLYVPLTYSVWSFLASLSQSTGGELNPRIFHAANIILHILSSLLVFGILRTVLTHGFRNNKNDGNIKDDFTVDSAALFGALLFGLHPIHVEPVAWVTGMKEMLSGFLSLIAVREYLAFAISSKTRLTGDKQNPSPGSFGPKRKNFHYAAATAAFLMAVLSKPVAVILPLIALIIDRWIIKRPFRESVLPVAVWLFASALFALIATSAQQAGTLLTGSPIWARPLIAGDAISFYLYKLVWPLQLGIDYGRSPDFVMRHWWFYATWLLPAALAAAIYFVKKREPFLACAGIIFVSLLPLLGFVEFFIQYRTTVFDHYFYFPFLGISILSSWLYANHKSTPVTVFAFVIICLLGVRSYQQVSTWKDDITLYTNAIKVNPLSDMANYNLGNKFRKIGRLDDAIYYYKKTIEIDPLSNKAQNNLGLTLEKLGRLSEAVYHYRKAVDIFPGEAASLNNLGTILTKSGKTGEAVTLLRKAIGIRPDYEEAHNNLGVALEKSGKFDEAIAHYNAALKINPGYGNAHNNLGVALETIGKLDEAIKHYKEAIRLLPNDPNSHSNMGIALTKIGEYEKAVSHFRRALGIMPDFAFAKQQMEIAIAKRDQQLKH